MKKTMKKAISFILILSLIFTMLPMMGVTVSAASSPKIGDYIYFGKYYDEPILWKVININANGDPLLFSDRIISIKAFDAAGINHTNSDDIRTEWGSNLWRDSNIRQWLNSSEKTISWIQNPPSEENMCDGDNLYDTEKGFLADGNFTESERDAIKPITHKSLLSYQDENLKDGGSESHEWEYNIEDVVQNYDDAYYHNVTDKVFLLDVKELHDYIYERGWDIKAYPTSEAVGNSIYKWGDLSNNKYCNYWLRSPGPDYSNRVRSVLGEGGVSFTIASSSDAGVRPALYLNLSSAILKSGSGSSDDPYTISWDQISYIPVTSIGLDKSEVNLATGNSFSLNATIWPTNATNKNVIWSSSNTNIATVDQNGKVIGIAEGNAIITAKSQDGNFKASCEITVKYLETKAKIGDYIYFGKYYDETILWKVINIDANGDPLLFSDRIISIKAFDAKGPNHTNSDDDRVNYGSNLWRDSNIRQWLNSSEKTISWIQNPPSEENMWEGQNPYDAEKGFLADGNFTESERNAIKPVTHKSLLSYQDENLKDGGSESHGELDYSIENIVQNYDDAYYHNVTDKVFLLDVKELHDYVYKRGWDIKAYPTSEAVGNSMYKWENLSNNKYWRYWLRSPYAGSSDGVRYVYGDGGVGNNDANHYGGGVRAALYLNLSSAIFRSGSGSYSNPYIVDRENGADTWNDFLEKTVYNNKTFKVEFNSDIDTSSITDNIFVSDDITGINKVEDIVCKISDTNANIVEISPKTYWKTGIHYIFISDKVKNTNGKNLKKGVRMKFTVSE